MPQTNPNILISLEQQIAAGRRKMQALWEARGYTDSDVLAASVELDDLMNRYQKLSS